MYHEWSSIINDGQMVLIVDTQGTGAGKWQAYLCTLQVHVVIPNLEVHPNNIYQRNEITKDFMSDYL